ncbi:protein of unknown function [Azospirillum baldaniorum]|uniref:Uncharacterized protein n=1 Tax=Azospirillum baldaniorum TaxID=1064539 RepID=A0A9P1JQY2_9PROT|nr:protein of unknown function [Azospirillum baldaniorum]
MPLLQSIGRRPRQSHRSAKRCPKSPGGGILRMAYRSPVDLGRRLGNNSATSTTVWGKAAQDAFNDPMNGIE